MCVGASLCARVDGDRPLDAPHAVGLAKPYVKRGKTDAADAEAVTRPMTRFVAVKSVEQQAVLMLHKSRDLMVRRRTMLINALRGHLAEYGIVTGLGAGGVVASLQALHEEQDRFPAHALSAFMVLPLG